MLQCFKVGYKQCWWFSSLIKSAFENFKYSLQKNIFSKLILKAAKAITIKNNIESNTAGESGIMSDFIVIFFFARLSFVDSCSSVFSESVFWLSSSVPSSAGNFSYDSLESN